MGAGRPPFYGNSKFYQAKLEEAVRELEKATEPDVIDYWQNVKDICEVKLFGYRKDEIE